MPSTKPKKYKILLDEALSQPTKYKQLNSHYAVVHVGNTKYQGAKDPIVYRFATIEKRIFITYNLKDFKRLGKSNTPTILAISPNLTTKETDLKLFKTLRELKSNETTGFIIFVSKKATIKHKFSPK